MYWQWMLPVSQLVREPDESRKSQIPVADVLHDDDGYHVILELPGVRQEDLTLSVEAEVLRVRATRGGRLETAKLVHDGRRADLPFERHFTLGDEIDRDHVVARLENGLLHISLPQRAEEKKRLIPVQVQEASV